jgi:hypothetical protein
MDTMDQMIGKVIVSITGYIGSKTMVFTDSNGVEFEFYHEQDCCENVVIEDICGDLDDLIGAPLTLAEELSNEDKPECNEDSYTWTFYRFASPKGTVTIRWLGTSNGYYSESVDFIVRPPTH